MNIVAGYGILSFHFLDRTARSVDFDLPAAVLAPEQVVVVRFQAGPADLGDIGHAFLPFEALLVVLVYLSDVAENLSGHFVVRIVADRLDVDGNPRQLVAPFFNFSDDILSQVVGQNRRDIGALYFFYFFPQLGFRDIQQLRQFAQLRVGHAVLRRHVGHHEAGPRADENLAVAVVHDAAHGRDGDSPQPVPFGQGVVILPFYELQIGQPADQYGEDSDDDPIQIPEAAVIALFFH